MSWLLHLPKPVMFAICGAMGCFIGALPGEGFLLLTANPPPPPPPPSPPMAICLLIDCSGSMRGSKLQEVKKAAGRFIGRQDFSRHRIGLVSFESAAYRLSALTDSPETLRLATQAITDGESTRMDLGLAESASVLDGANKKKVVLLFTDGMPDDRNVTLSVGNQIRSDGTMIVAIATGDADVRYLESLTGDRTKVFYAASGAYEQGFDQAENAIFNRQLFESEFGNYTYAQSLFRVSGWTMFLAGGIGLAIAYAQSWLVGRKQIGWKRFVALAAMSMTAGIAAGFSGQVLYSMFSWWPAVDVVTRTAAWALLGALLGGGMSYVIPNFHAKRGMVGGAIGASLGAIGFLVVAAATTDFVGRFLGALLIGACIGACVGVVEILFREAWLKVAFGPKEIVSVTLGTKPVILSSDERATIYIPSTSNVALEYLVQSERLHMTDLTTGQRGSPVVGEWELFGRIAVSVNTSDRRADDSLLKELWKEEAAAERTPPRTETHFVLCLPSGAIVHLYDDAILNGNDIGESGGEPFAQVMKHPTDASKRGLVNLSEQRWRVRNKEGDATEIEKGGTITLKEGLTITFGTVTAEVGRN